MTDDRWRRFMEALERRLGPREVALVARSVRGGPTGPVRFELAAELLPSALRKLLEAEVTLAWAETLGGVAPLGGDADPLTFDSFVAGWCNEHALAQVREIAVGGHGAVLLLGPTGLGKTHLLHAAANAALACGRRVAWAGSAATAGRGDLLLVDNAYGLALGGDAASGTIASVNEACVRGAAVLVASGALPAPNVLPPTWRVALLHALDAPTALRITEARAAMRALPIPAWLTARLALRATSVHEIDARLDRLARLRGRVRGPITPALLRARAPDLLGGPEILAH